MDHPVSCEITYDISSDCGTFLLVTVSLVVKNKKKEKKKEKEKKE